MPPSSQLPHLRPYPTPRAATAAGRPQQDEPECKAAAAPRDGGGAGVQSRAEGAGAQHCPRGRPPQEGEARADAGGAGTAPAGASPPPSPPAPPSSTPSPPGPSCSAPFLQELLREQKRREAEQDRLEAGYQPVKLSKKEQQEQAILNQRKNKAGVRQAKTGAAAHKFDAEAHAARKAGKSNKAEKARAVATFARGARTG
eukprot:SAG31_NODE_4069_length_3619_cov_17.893466_5_plen_200_part_00